jgi:hypothetical protein
VDKKYEWEYVKNAVNAFEFIEQDSFKKFFKNQNFAFIGHNRWATKGKIETKNAHPFRHGKIIGVHNGTLWGEALLPKYKRYDTDSESLIRSIAKAGIKDVWKKVRGAATVVWWDQKENAMYFIGNGERPLHYSYDKNKTVMYLSSEKGILTASLLRNNTNNVRQYPIAKDVLHKINWNAKEKQMELTKETLEGAKDYYQNYQRNTCYNNGIGFTNWDNEVWDSTLRQWVPKDKKKDETYRGLFKPFGSEVFFTFYIKSEKKAFTQFVGRTKENHTVVLNTWEDDDNAAKLKIGVEYKGTVQSTHIGNSDDGKVTYYVSERSIVPVVGTFVFDEEGDKEFLPIGH